MPWQEGFLFPLVSACPAALGPVLGAFTRPRALRTADGSGKKMALSVNGGRTMPAWWTLSRDVNRSHSRVGLAAVTWPDHIPRPVPSSGDLRACGESHSPLLPDFCSDRQNRKQPRRMWTTCGVLSGVHSSLPHGGLLGLWGRGQSGRWGTEQSWDSGGGAEPPADSPVKPWIDPTGL